MPTIKTLLPVVQIGVKTFKTTNKINKKYFFRRFAKKNC